MVVTSILEVACQLSYIIFYVFITVTVQIVVFWLVTPCSLVGGQRGSEEYVASVFRVEICKLMNCILCRHIARKIITETWHEENTQEPWKGLSFLAIPFLTCDKGNDEPLQTTIFLYRLHPVVCIISYGYDCQHSNKAVYLRVMTKTVVDMYLTYLIWAWISCYVNNTILTGDNLSASYVSPNNHRKKTLNYEHITHMRVSFCEKL
jgi:hypothetical protein